MKKILSIALMLCIASRIMAVPAFPELIRFQQPNSEIQLNIFLKGDEKVHWAETEDGYSLLYDDAHRLVYATKDNQGNMVPTTFVAADAKDRSILEINFLAQTPKHIHYSQSQVNEMVSLWNDLSRMSKPAKTMSDVLGEKRFLVILFAFNDKAFSHSKTEFRNLFNQVGYSANGAVGSVHDYYYDVSHHQFSLQVDVVGPYRGSHEASFYGSNDDQTAGYQAFAEEAVEFASHEVNFDNYDNDHDGYIDGLHIIFAGHGEEAGAGDDCIWSHKWNIFSSPTYNNTIVNVYSCSPECSGNLGNTLTAIGVVCHELGHVFGAPDYYDTDYASSGGQYPGLGTWDIMSSGSWNRGGKCPAHHNPYTKIFIYKWANCDTLSDPQKVLMNNVTASNTDFHRINTSTSGDFFLLENRMCLKWDKPLSGQGLLVYHVHPDAHGANVSNFRHPQQIYILGHSSYALPTSNVSSYGNIEGADAVYPRSGNQLDSLTDNSTPAIRPWSGAANNTPLTHISINEVDSTVAFCFKGANPAPFNFFANGITNTQVKLNWQRYGSYRYLVTMSKNQRGNIPQQHFAQGDTIDGDWTVIYKGNSDHTIIDNLSSDTNYYFQIFLCLTDSTYAQDLNAWAHPLECEATHWTSENFDQVNEGSLPSCWDNITGNWQTNAINHGSHNQAANLALMCENAGTIASAPFGADSAINMVLTFKANSSISSDFLEVLYRNDPTADWQNLGSYTLTQEWATHSVSLPEASSYSRFAFRHANNGVILIDDVTLTQGHLLNATCDPHGNITPKGYRVVQLGDSITFTISREPGYKIKRILVDGTSRTFEHGSRTSTYTLAVKGSHTVHAEFDRDLDIQESQPTLKVYPNPTHSNVQVQLPQTTHLELYDITGRKLWSTNANEGTTIIPTADLPRGIYLLRANGTVTKIVRK